jgi:hypothetical protein
MDTTRLKLGILPAIVVTGAAMLLVMQYQRQDILQAENDALRQQLQQASRLAADNERLPNPVAQARSRQSLSEKRAMELLQLRGEVGRIRQEVKEIEALREANRQASVELAASRKAAAAGSAAEPASVDHWPKDSWQSLGYATPEAVMQSQLYAASRGEVNAFLASITDGMQHEVEKDLGGKTESEVNAKMKEKTDHFQSVRVLKRETLSDDMAALTVALQGPTNTANVKLTLSKIGNDWKLAKIDPPHGCPRRRRAGSEIRR